MPQTGHSVITKWVMESLNFIYQKSFLFFNLWFGSDLACLIIWPNLFITFDFKEGVQEFFLPQQEEWAWFLVTPIASCSRDLSRWRPCMWPWCSQVQWFSMLAVPPRNAVHRASTPAFLPSAFDFFIVFFFHCFFFFILIFQAIAFRFLELMFPLTIWPFLIWRFQDTDLKKKKKKKGESKVFYPKISPICPDSPVQEWSFGHYS